MPAIVANAKNFLMSSDYPLDKVVYMATGSITIASGGLAPLTLIPHGLPFRPLMLWSYSTTPDFASTRTNGVMGYGPSSQLVLDVGTADATNVRISPYNTTGSTQTLYYRLFGFMPSDADPNSLSAATTSLSSPFELNSGYNYMKLLKDGFQAAPAAGTSVTITHGLGYRPRTLIWTLSTNGIIQLYAPGSTDLTDATSDRITIDTTGLNIYAGTSTSLSGVYYRIYLDA